MEEIRETFLSTPLQTEAKFLIRLKEQQVFDTYVLYLMITKAVKFPYMKLSEIHFY